MYILSYWGEKGCENEDCELWGCKGGLIDRGGLAWERCFN